jgi:hypothetical protein
MARDVSVLVGAQPITHGVQMGESNTGLNYRGVSRSSLTPTLGPQTFSTAGQTVQGKYFDNTVHISANNITVQDCLMEGGTLNRYGFVVDNGVTGTTFSGVTVRRGVNASWYICLQTNPTSSGTTVSRCDISGGKTQFTNYGDNTQLLYSYFHDTDLTSDLTNHPDNLEWYGGNNGLIQYCSMPMGTIQFDASVNIAPFSTYSVNGLTIADSWLDGGQAQIIGNGGSNSVLNVAVLRNKFGGHSNPDTVMSFGVYKACSYWAVQGICDTTAQQSASGGLKILWPSTGPDVNYWYGCSDLSPDNTGQVCMPS